MTTRECRSGAGVVGGRVRLHQRLDRVALDVAVGPGEDPALGVGLVEQARELLVVDHRARALALQHLDQLRSGERGVEVEDVGAQLGGGDGRVDEEAVVAAHHRDAVALADAHLPQRVGRARCCAGGSRRT